MLLLATAVLFASNHVAARIAFDDGAGLVLAIVLRSVVAGLIMFTVARVQRQSFKVPVNTRPWLITIGFLIAVQSWSLYSSVSVIPIAVALLMLNAWPVIYITISWLAGGQRPSLPLALSLGVIIFGLTLVMNVSGAMNDPSLTTGQWWLGISYGLTAAVVFAFAMWIINNKMGAISGSVRSSYTMLIVGSSLLTIGLFGWLPSSFSLPASFNGYLGLFLLTVFYGVASTVLFVLAPKLDMTRNSPVLNFEPVASLLLGFVFLGQVLSPIQLIGGGLVLTGIVSVGLIR